MATKGKKGENKVRRVVYLVKPKVRLEDTLRSSVSTIPITVDGAKRAFLAVSPQVEGKPSWVHLFADQDLPTDHRRQLDKLAVASTAAVLLIELPGAGFAIPFGFGWHLLDGQKLDETFGLRVVLNSVESNALKSIDRASLEITGHRTREQAPKASSIGDFGINFDQDLIKAVTGTPKDATLGRTISGADSLAVSLPNRSKELALPLLALKKWAGKKNYRAKFAWVDKVRELRDVGIIGKLDGEVASRLRTTNPAKVWLAPPEIIEWREAPRFRYRGFRDKRIYDDIFLDEFRSACPTATSIDVDQLKSWSVQQLDAESNPKREWSLYRCLYAEATIDGKIYVLNGGRWYRVDRDFVTEVDTEVKPYLEGKHAQINLPDYAHDSEAAYNKSVSDGDATLACLDKQTIFYGGKQSQIEVCDLFSRDRKLIHVKRYSGSATLSHLFSQGTVSAEAIIADAEFRRRFNEKLPRSHRLARPLDRIEPQHWSVVYAIVTKAPPHLDLPFFSRVTLRAALRRLVSMGLHVGLTRIRDVAPK